MLLAVNSSHHINRQRFTLAHELGHFFLHEDMEEHVDQNLRVAWRNSQLFQGGKLAENRGQSICGRIIDAKGVPHARLGFPLRK